MNGKTYKIGIIGANWSLKVHGTAWRMLPNVEVAAICTAHRETAEAAAQQFGIGKAYWNVNEMAADPDIDIIDVGSQPSFRYDMVLAALKNGKHVYNALPFAVNAQKAKKMHEAQAASGRVGVVDAQFRWVPAAMYMKQLLDDGFLGKPLGFNAQLMLPLRNHDGFLYPHSVWPGNGISPYRWLADKNSGAGGWRNFATHSVLFLTHLLGEVEEVVGMQSTGIKQWTLPDESTLTADNEDLGCATLRLKNGVIGNLQTGWAVPDTAGLRVEIWGEKGRLLLADPSFGDGVSARLYAGGADQMPFVYGSEAGQWLDIPGHYFQVPGTSFSKENAPPYMVSMGWMFHDMLKSIEEGRKGSPDFTEAYHAQRVVEAALLSQEERRWVRVEEIH
ncbi:Gfo/Idh/MocA family protein [Pseudomonas sp. GB2N2]